MLSLFVTRSERVARASARRPHRALPRLHERLCLPLAEALMHTDLCAEATRLTRVVRTLHGADPPAEVSGVLALMLLQDSRRHTRVDAAGDLVVLEKVGPS